jgi:hypothetical protein
MTNLEKVTDLRLQILRIKQDLVDNQPSRCTMEDIEDVSDVYQSNLEYQWYREEMEAEIAELEVEIARIELLPSGGQFDENPWSFEEAQDKYYSNAPEGMFYGMDRNGNKGYFEDFEQSIGE